VAAAGGRAELIVSDNGSGDHTAEVVEWASALGPIRYHRHPSDIGSMRNVYGLVQDLARGEFVWVLGNDDIVREGSVERILTAIERQPELDYIYVNYSPLHGVEDPVGIISAGEFPDLPPHNPDVSDHYLERLGELVAADYECFTPFYCAVMRRGLAVSTYEMCIHGEAWDSIENAVPQAVVVAQRLLDKPAWYIGHPCIITNRKPSWTDHVPMFFFVTLPDVYDYFERAGVKRSVLDVHRRRILADDLAVACMLKVLTRPDLPMPRKFSVWKFIWKNRRFKELWALLLKVCKGLLYQYSSSLPHPVRNALRWLRKRLGRLSATV
jgi:glycosyltransferase involved in cell wall biosynthesis